MICTVSKAEFSAIIYITEDFNKWHLFVPGSSQRNSQKVNPFTRSNQISRETTRLTPSINFVTGAEFQCRYLYSCEKKILSHLILNTTKSQIADVLICTGNSTILLLLIESQIKSTCRQFECTSSEWNPAVPIYLAQAMHLWTRS